MADNKDIKKAKEGIPFNLAALFIFLSFLIILAGYAYYANYKENLINRVKEQLAATCERNVSQIVQWRKERLGYAKYILNNVLIADEINFLLKEQHQAMKKDILTWLTNTKESFNYKEVAIFDNNGKFVFSSVEVIHQDTDHAIQAKRSLEKQDVFMGDIHVNDKTGEVDLGIFIPVIASDKKQALAGGGIMLLIDPATFLYPLIESWSEKSETAESLLLRKDGDKVVFLNETRHKKNTVILLGLPVTDAGRVESMAVRGAEGIVEGNDYRNLPVMASIRKVPETGWYHISKIDLKEVYLPAEKTLKIIYAFVIAGILISAASITLFWRNQRTAHYKRLYKMEESLRQSEEKYHNLYLESPIGVYHSTFDGKFMDMNPALARMLGYDSSGQAVESITNIGEQIYADPAARKMLMDKVMKEDRFVPIESRFLRRDGTPWYGFLHMRLIKDQTGAPLHLEGLIEDITERKSMEEEIRESSSRFSALFENMIEGVAMHEVIYDDKGAPADYRIIDVNKAFEDFTGIPKERAIGALASELYGIGTAPYLNEYYEVARSGNPLSFETYFPPMKKHFSISVVSTNPDQFATIFMDITDQKRNEDELKRYASELEKSNRLFQEALADVKTLSTMLPICASCKKIRDDKGYWNQIESYISEHTDTLFSHGICPDCAKKAYEELEELKKMNPESGSQDL